MATSSTSILPLPLEFLPPKSVSAATLNQAKIIEGWLGNDPAELNKQNATAIRLDMYPGITQCVVDDGESQSVVHKAAQKADSLALKIFLQKNCLNDVPDKNGDTPLAILVERYIERENRPDLREVIIAMIRKGARLDHANNQVLTPMMRILAGKSEILFHQCLEIEGAPWAHAFIYLAGISDELDEHLQNRLNLVLSKPTLRANLILSFLGVDFSAKPKPLAKMLRTLVHETPYSPLWLDALRTDKAQKSVWCKMDALAKENVEEAMHKHFVGLGYDKNAQYAAINRWFERPKLPPPNTTSDAGDKLHKNSSWGHPSRPHDATLLRKRGDSAVELVEAMNLTQLYKFVAGNDAQKRLGINRFKANACNYVVTRDKEEMGIVQEILQRNPKLINQAYNGTFLLIKTIQGRCSAMTRFLLDNDASPNVYDDQYDTPLHHALYAENEKSNEQTPRILAHLLSKGANFNSLNRRLRSPLNLLFEMSRPELFEPFLELPVDWFSLVEKEITKGFPRTEQEKRCILLLLKQKKISPKALLAALLKRSFDERDKFLQQLLRETLVLCEKMELVEVEALAADTKSDSLREKVKVFKAVPKFYTDVLHSLFQQSHFSSMLLESMLEEKDPDLNPDYDLIFDDEDKNSRRNKIQLLMNLSIIKTQRKAEQLASGKTLGCAEAFALGFAQLLPDLTSINWLSQLKELAGERQTLAPIQVGLLRKVFARDQAPLREVIGMLFQQDVRRSDPLKPGPFEIMLDIAVSHCKIIYPEWADILMIDKDPISYQRKIEICDRYPQFGGLLKNEIRLRVGALRSSSPGKLERTNSSSISRSSSRGHSRSNPGSGTSTPRGTLKEKK